MKKDKKIRSSMLLATGGLVLLFVTTTAFTLNRQAVEGRGPVRELAGYFKENMKPVLTPVRGDFEDKLSKGDREIVEQARYELIQAWQTRKEAGIKPDIAGRKAFFMENALSDEQVEAVRKSRDLAYSALLKTMIIADKYDKELSAVFNSLDNEREIWKKDLRNIISSNKPGRALVMNPVLKENLERTADPERIGKLLFVLWNPDRPELLRSFENSGQSGNGM